jgi:dTDP-4-amino-4,6-dideoxygalactose transaminase
LGRSDEFMAARTAIVEKFNAAFADLPGVVTPTQADWATHAWHLYVLRVDPEKIRDGRDGLVADLADCSIGSSVHFIPLHHHPVYREEAAAFVPHLTETDRYYREAVSLPLFPDMTDQEVADVITVVTESIARRTR